MLAYVRVKHHASMTAFATQLAQITTALKPGGDKAHPKAPPAAPAGAQLPKLQSALKVCGFVVLGAGRKLAGGPAGIAPPYMRLLPFVSFAECPW